MKVLEDLKELLEDELKKIAKKGDISPAELESVYKATDVIKDIETIKAMKEYGEDEQSMPGMEGQSQRRDDYSQRRGGYSQRGNEYSERYMMPIYHPYYNSMDYSQNEGGMSNRGGQGMSNRYDRSYDDGMSNAGRRGRDADSDGRYSEDEGNSYRRGRDARGRYTSRDGNYNWNYDRGYSRHTEQEMKMIAKLENMLEETTDESKKRAIMQCIDKLES